MHISVDDPLSQSISVGHNVTDLATLIYSPPARQVHH